MKVVSRGDFRKTTEESSDCCEYFQHLFSKSSTRIDDLHRSRQSVLLRVDILTTRVLFPSSLCAAWHRAQSTRASRRIGGHARGWTGSGTKASPSVFVLDTAFCRVLLSAVLSRLFGGVAELVVLLLYVSATRHPLFVHKTTEKNLVAERPFRRSTVCVTRVLQGQAPCIGAL